MADKIRYNGEDKWKIKATQLLNQGGGGGGSEGSSLSLDGRKFIFIGDSYQEGWTDSIGTVITIDSWLDYFISWYGSEFNGYYRNQAGGWGFAKTNCQFITLLQALESTITDKADITDIVVEGGFNDHAYLSGIDSAILAFRNYARQTYPNATLWIAPVSRGINQFEADADAAHKIYIDSGMKYGFNICGEITRVMLNENYYSTDLVHPTADGYKQICKYMHQCLTTGACDLLTGVAEISDLATVATSGDYDDLINKPTIPAAQVNSDWNASSGVAEILNKPSIYTQSQTDTLLAAKQNSLVGGSISSGDLDDYTTIGHYYVNTTGASSVSHLPVALAGYLEVIQPSTSSGGSRLQRYTAISGNAIVGVYERNYNASAWQTWKQIGEDVYLPLTGGELSGDLAIVEDSPTMVIADTNIELGTAPSNNQGNYIAFADKNKDGSSYVGRVYGEYRSNGVTRLYLQVGNISSVDDSFIRNSNFIEKRADGTNVYNLEDPKAFRSAIGINDAPSVVEDVKSSSQAVSVADTTHTTVLQISLTPGTWMVNATAIFASNSTGYRQMYVTTSNTSTSAFNTMTATSSAVNGLLTALNTGRAVEISSNTTLYMRVRHSRGSALDVYGRLTAVKIINV